MRREYRGMTRAASACATGWGWVPNAFTIPIAYPGRGPSGDLPPRRECAELWLERVLAEMPHIELTLLVGAYAQQRFLGAERRASLTETVAAWREYGPSRVPLPHPSPRNQGWFKHHPWFERELLPVLKARVADALSRKRIKASA